MWRVPFLKRRFAGQSHSSVQSPLRVSPSFSLTKSPAFIQTRSRLFEKLWKAQESRLQGRPKVPIRIVLPDKSVKNGVSHTTTPMEIAKSISKTLAKSAIVAEIQYDRKEDQLEERISSTEAEEFPRSSDTMLWDLGRELTGDCRIRILTFEDLVGKQTFWHSSAHVLGAALEELYGGLLCVGPPTESGFFYDAFLGEHSLAQGNFPEIEKFAMELAAKRLEFQRLVVSKEEALELFAYNPFKSHLIATKVAPGDKTTVYRCGPLVDLCTGPHIPHSGLIKAIAMVKNSSAYWLGQSQNDSLQRIYGVSFPDKKQMEEYVETQRKISQSDHHLIGKSQDLYFWHQSSPGSTFFLPFGARIYNRLVEFMRREYRFRGYDEVISPNLFSSDLWKTSGHYQKYREDMFLLSIEGQEWGLKPMNCPSHCVMFGNSQRSYRELPIRYADFGALHRNEASGALSGLTRVRRFQQDDGHIFCRKDQIAQEVLSNLEFLSFVYETFGFTYELELSTKPKNALGGEELWKTAEKQLEEALNSFGKPWKINAGDGAFYGPKIDMKVYDGMKRKHQCGTIQLDFNLPKRFNLQYKSEENSGNPHSELTQYEDCEEKPVRQGFERPVIIHRAILGSMERMMAVLAENYAGKWPFWLSPRQVIVIPVSEKFGNYAKRVGNRLEVEGFYAEVDTSSLTLSKKIRNAQVAQINYICVVGKEEMEAESVDVRDRDQSRSLGKFSLSAFLSHLRRQHPSKSQAETSAWRESSLEAIEVRYDVSLSSLESRLSSLDFLCGASAGEEDWRVFHSFPCSPDPTKHPKTSAWFQRLSSLKSA